MPLYLACRWRQRLNTLILGAPYPGSALAAWSNVSPDADFIASGFSLFALFLAVLPGLVPLKTASNFGSKIKVEIVQKIIWYYFFFCMGSGGILLFSWN